MTPAFDSKFLVATKKLRVTDTFNYSSIIKDAVYANVLGKVGNSPFTNNTNFDSSADIVIGTNTSADFDLPLSDSVILNGTYSVTERVKIINEVLYRSSIGSGYMAVSAPGANNFTQIQLSTPIASLIADIAALQATHDDVRVGFYTSGNVYLGTTGTINCNDDDLITFAAVAISAYATIAKIRIIGSNIYETTTLYTWTGCDTVTPKLQATVDCYRSQLFIVDCTAYPAGITLTRTLTAQYPTLADGSHVLPTESTNEASLTLGPNIWSGGYTIDLSSVVSYQQDDDLYVENTVTAQITPTVTCNNLLCALSTCITKFFNKYKAAIANGSRDTANLTVDVITIGGYLDLININLQCEDSAKVSTLVSQLNTYMGEDSVSEGCDCGCSDSTTNTTPTEIFPLFTTPTSDGRLVTLNTSLAYPTFQQLYFEGQTFLTLSATAAGETPNSVRGKFKWLGGGINPGNTAQNTAGGSTATLNKNSGVVTFLGVSIAAFTDQLTVVITNTTVSDGTDVECYLTNVADGQGTIVNKAITNNTITLTIENLNNSGDPVIEFSVWINNKA